MKCTFCNNEADIETKTGMPICMDYANTCPALVEDTEFSSKVEKLKNLILRTLEQKSTE